MERRKFLLGMGAVAAGGTAALGTGAISQSNIERGFEVEVRGDYNAYVQISPGQNNPEYVSGEGDGTYRVDLPRMNNDSENLFDDVLTIENTAPRDLTFSIQKYKNGNRKLHTANSVDPSDRVRFYADWAYPPTKAMRLDQDDAFSLSKDIPSGNSFELTVEVSTGDTAPESPHHLNGGSFGNDLSPGDVLIDNAVIVAQNAGDTTDSNDP